MSVIAVLMIGLYSLNLKFIDKLAFQVEDRKFDIRTVLGKVPQPNDNVVIVAIDEKSVKRMGRYPWDRDVFGDLLANLRAADLVGLDIIFGERTTPEKDLYLADVIAENNNVITGFHFRDKSVVETSQEHIDILQDCAYFDVELLDDVIGIKDYAYSDVNIPEIADSSLSCGFFGNLPDPDGLFRQYPLAYIHKSYVFPPLAVQLVRFHLNEEAKIIADKDGIVSFSLGSILLKDENYFRFNFYPLDKDIYISAVDVYDGTIKPEFFQDKIVLVGDTEMGLYDIRPSPVDPISPGVWLHYTALSNLMNN